MVNQHAFGFPQWYIDSISYPELFPYAKYIARFGAFALVPLFLFLTGYTYFYHNDKSFKYSFRKIISFLFDYWIIYGVILLLACTFSNYNISLISTLKEMFSLSGEVMIFNWYVFVYIEVMLFLPLLDKIMSSRNLKQGAIIIFAIFLIMECIGLSLYFAGMKDTFLHKITSSYFVKQVSVATIGYCIAKYNLFSRWYPYIKNINQIFIYICLCLCILIYQVKTKTTYLLTPLYVILMFSLNINYNNVLNRVIIFFAKHSMNIWFLHCIFWGTATRNVFQKYAYLPENPILVVLWVLFLCSCLSLIITPIQKTFKRRLANITN